MQGIVMLKLYAQAALYQVKPTVQSKQEGGSYQLPILPANTLKETLKVSAEHCNAYNGLTNWGGQFAALLHPNYIQTLSLPMQLAMMVSQPFPFKPIGLVHVANNIKVQKLPEQSAQLSLSTEFGKIYFHRRGWLFEVKTFAREQGSQSAMHNIQATSYYLARSKHSLQQSEHFKEKCENAPKWIQDAAQGALDLVAQQSNRSSNELARHDFMFAKDIGRKYAKISNDYNPIHLYPFTARLLGFKKAIAHGMYSKAWAVSQLIKTYSFTQPSFEVNTTFLNPILLPLTTTLLSTTGQSGNAEIRFALQSLKNGTQNMHLYGVIRAGI